MNGTYETKLDSLCGFDRPNTIVSFSNFIKINFQTDSDQEYKGYTTERCFGKWGNCVWRCYNQWSQCF